MFALGGLQGMLIGGAVAAALAFGVGTQVGQGWERGACDKRMEKVRKAAEKVIDDKIKEVDVSHVERDQARAEVDKVNKAEAEKAAIAEAATQADQVRREEALARTEAAATEAAKASRTLSAKLTSSLEAIRNVADECARAPLSPDSKRLLDGILSP